MIVVSAIGKYEDEQQTSATEFWRADTVVSSAVVSLSYHIVCGSRSDKTVQTHDQI